ncbi:MAG: TonB-dependent receptor plug domain-containing protein [Kofleriaceae bacterium]
MQSSRSISGIAAAAMIAATAIADADPPVDPSAVQPAPAAPAPKLDGETIVILDRAPDHAAPDRQRALGDAPFVTVVRPDDHPATASIADAVASSVGVQIKSLGGLGSFQSINVRGASPGHTAVLLDGVPLARIAAVTADLGRFSLDSFSSVELYRGSVPVELGGAGVGGALNMVTRLGRGDRGERISASTGAGSYGSHHARARYGDDYASFASSITAGYQAATGNYSFFDGNSTPLNPNDDQFAVRHNNGFRQLDGAVRVGSTDRTAVAGARAIWKRQGLPGSVAQPALDAELTTLDVVADGRIDARVGAAVARQLGYVLVERQRLRDPMGELGLGAADRKYLTVSGGASSTWKLPLGAHSLATGLELRGDRFVDRDATGVQPRLSGTRVGGAVLAAFDVAVTRNLSITPAARFDAVRSAPTPMTSGPDALAMVPPRWDVVPSPRLAMRIAISDDAAFKGSAGWYVRLPTLLEVFGNRGYVIGSPDLRPERGPSSELGVVWAPATAIGPVDRILVEADVFGNRAHDAIALISTAGFAARAANIGDTQAYGAELVGSVRLARTVSVTTSYTRLVTEQISNDVNVDGKPVPRAPGHKLYARVDVVRTIARRLASVWIDTSWHSTSFLDPASLGRVPGRALVGAGARCELGWGTALAVSVANLTDLRITELPLDPPPSPTFTGAPTALTDVAGFPLPGRSYYASLEWTY